VRTAYLNQLIVDLNAQIDATFLIVTHDINTARTVPDNIGMLFRRNLVMFGPREVLLTSPEPVVEQFLNGRRQGPIGMSEEKDAGQAAAELEQLRGDSGLPHIIPQLEVSDGLPERAAVRRRQARVMANLGSLTPEAQQEIVQSLLPQERRHGEVTDAARLRTESMSGSLSAPGDHSQPKPEPRPEEPPWAMGHTPEDDVTPRKRLFGRRRGDAR
jgi:phospholipid/cholesterol/gamma-HCH transport system ATP-binding protein